jgi:hypothetical protein
MLEVLALLLYLFASRANPIPFIVLTAVYCFRRKGELHKVDGVGLFMFMYHLMLLFRMAGEYGYDHINPFPASNTNRTPEPTPLFTVEGYSATTILYFCIAVPCLWSLPPSIVGEWYFWTGIVSAFSVWVTIPTQLPGSITMSKETGLYAGLALLIPLTLLLIYSPERGYDTAHVALFAITMAVLIANGVHVHHSQWPWALIPLMRHGTVYHGTAAAILIGAATQEVAGSGFHLNVPAGY